jgi:hypothetical protein
MRRSAPFRITKDERPNWPVWETAGGLSGCREFQAKEQACGAVLVGKLMPIDAETVC